MPYEGEFAQYKSITRITQNPRVRNLLSNCHIKPSEPTSANLSECLVDIEPSARLPKWIIAVDGSKQEIPVRNEFPGAEVAYLTVASVMLNIEKMIELDA